MKPIVAKTWKKHNRSERIKSILEILNRSGEAEAKYFKRRSFLAAFFLGEGCSRPVREEDEWNRVEITYQGKKAVEMSDSILWYERWFFDKKFTKSEIDEVGSALASMEVKIAEDSIWNTD